MRKLLLPFSFAILGLASAASIAEENLTADLGALVSQADSVTIEFHPSSRKDNVTFADFFWVERLAGIMAFTSYKPRELCLCTSFPAISLKKNGEVLCRISVHHGDKLRFQSEKITGDFLVGDKTGKAIVNLAEEMRRSGKPGD